MSAGTSVRPSGEPVGWSPRQLQTLGALAEAFAPGFGTDDYRRLTRAAAETLNAVADPDDLRQLRLVVSALDSPVANLGTGGGWHRFSRLEAAERDRLLLGWAQSRPAMTPLTGICLGRINPICIRRSQTGQLPARSSAGRSDENRT